MYTSRQNNLFRTYRLSDYLSGVLQSLSLEIDGLSADQINEVAEEDFVKKMVSKYSISKPEVDTKNLKVDAKESQVTISDRNSRLDYSNTISTKGLSITVSISFSGDQQLFQCMPSTYSLSGTPDAQIYGNNLILSYQTTEKDPEKIKQLWLADITLINKNIEWIGNDIVKYNDSLEKNIRAILTKRKQEANSYKSIIDKLKQG